MTEKNPDAASKLACPEEEIPMGMTPWSQLDEEARARASRPAPADGQKSPAPGTASVAPEPAPAPQEEAPIPMPAAEAVQPEDTPAAPVAAPVEGPAADQTPEAPLSMEAGEAPAALAGAAQPVPATEPAVTAEEKADGSEAPAEDVAADAAAAAAMAEAPRSGRRGLATMQPAALDEQIPAADTAPLPEEGQTPAPQAEAPAAPAAPAAAPVAVLEAGPAQKTFAVLAKMGPLALLLLLACQLWPTFLTGGLYCPPEMKLMDTVREALASGQWFAPLHNGDAQLPVFVWMLAALDLVARMVPQLSAFVWPAGAALGGLACLWGTWALSRAAGFGPQAALASGLILLSSLLFPQLAHFMGPQGLATGLCLLSMAFFCMGWKKEHAWISLPLAFLTSGLAALTGGLVFLILPLLTSLVHLFWTWRIRRAQRLDALAGFLLLLLLGTLWAAAIIFWAQAEGYAQAVSGKFISLPWPLPAFWWLAPALAVLGLLPWLFVVTGVNWGRVFATSWKTLRASRKENSGSSFLWIALVFSLPLSLLGSGLAGATPALCLLAILLGRALVRMGSLGSKFFYLVIALLFLHAGMLLAALHFPVALEWLRTSTSLAIPQQYEALLTSLDALPVLGGLCIVFAVLLARFTRRAWPGGSLLVCTLFAIILAQPAHLWLAPQLAGHAELKLAAAQPLNAAAPAAPAAVEESAVPAAPEAAAETAAPETPAADAAAPEAAPEAAPATEGTAPAAPATAAPAEAAPAPETTEATTPATDAAAPAETQAAPAEEAAAPAPAEGTPAPAENTQAAEPVQEAPAVQTLPAGPEHGAPIPPEAVPAQ
ncbi:hypothetical protein [Desulfovibrio piger]|uniref:hypothetical protein n=1 Tax=Desulfovibrio piger TaxID=901 RepID=UPI0026ECC27A|nr:hypothetical protein [Desulfovibrio piger]MCI7617169.1 hypothetical protein [Desulfovibrio piger]